MLQLRGLLVDTWPPATGHQPDLKWASAYMDYVQANSYWTQKFWCPLELFSSLMVGLNKIIITMITISRFGPSYKNYVLLCFGDASSLF